MDIMVNPTITKFAQKVDGEITELKLGANQEDAYAQIYAKGAESGSGKVENNKAATINVSTYTQPVEITPTSGKTSMKKATITLSNIPSPSGVSALYAWQNESEYIIYTTTSIPTTSDICLEPESHGKYISTTPITAVGEGTITTSSGTYTRDTDDDISLT